MKDVTLGTGKIVTDAEYCTRRGERTTDFVATYSDLMALAEVLIKECADRLFFLELQVSREEIDYYETLTFRFDRVVDCLTPEDNTVVTKKYQEALAEAKAQGEQTAKEESSEKGAA